MDDWKKTVDEIFASLEKPLTEHEKTCPICSAQNEVQKDGSE